MTGALLLEPPAILSVPVAGAQVEEARARAKALGALQRSIRRGRGNVIGYLGQIAARDSLGMREADLRSFDLIADDGRRIEVKTAACTARPQYHYACNVALTSFKHQRPDAFLFVRVLSRAHQPITEAFLLGWISADRFEQISRRVKLAEQDHRNRWRASAACQQVLVNELHGLRVVA